MNYEQLLSVIVENITSNNQKAITGAITRNVLSEMVASLGRGYQWMGIATPSTNPGTPDQRVFYLAVEAGTYTNFGNIEVSSPTFLYWDSSWHSQSFSAGGAGSVSLSNVAQTGTRIVTITIDGVSTDIKAPISGGSAVSIRSLLASGTLIGILTIDGVDYNLRAPSGGGGSTVQLWPIQNTGVRIATMVINGVEYHLYEPSPEGGGSVVGISNLLPSGTRVATLTIDGQSYQIKVPETDIQILNVLPNGVRVATIILGEYEYSIRVPKSVTVTLAGTADAPKIKVDLGDGATGEVALPIADYTHAGIVSTVDQIFKGAKTFDRIYLGNSGASGAYVEWDDIRGAFKFVGDMYATGDVAASM